MQPFHRFSPATTVVRHRSTETAIVDFPARTDVGLTYSSLKRQIGPDRPIEPARFGRAKRSEPCGIFVPRS